MGERIDGDLWIKIRKRELASVIDLLECAEAHDVIKEVLAEKGYLSYFHKDEESPTTSGADQQWKTYPDKNGLWEIATVEYKHITIARGIVSPHDAIAIAALPDLVKAAKGALRFLENNTEVYHKNETVAIRGIGEALAKAGEML